MSDPQLASDPNVKSVGHYRQFGHGHVIERPDGVKSRCGGPRLCNQCRGEEAALAKQTETPKTDAVEFTITRLNGAMRACAYRVVHARFARAQEGRIAELEAHNATLERSNKRLREKYDELLSERDMHERATSQRGSGLCG